MAKVCKFQKEKEVVSYDCGETWSPTGESRKIQGQAPVEKPSMDCGWTGIFTYRWDVDESGYICNGYDKYSKLVQYYSYDQGETWDKVDGSDQIGTLLERFSADCCYLRNISGESFCTCELQKVNGSLVEASLDNQNWIYTGKYVVDEVVDDFPTDCFEMGGWCTVVQYTDGHNAIANCGDSEILCDPINTLFDAEGITKIWYNCTEDFQNHLHHDFKVPFYETLEKVYFTENFSSSSLTGNYNECSGLTDVIGLENTSIVTMAASFYNCTSLSAITLPTSCTSVGEDYQYPYDEYHGFMNCTSLKYINLENCTSEICGSAFEDCTGLTGVTLPPTCGTFSRPQGLGSRIFFGCTSLKEVDFPSGLTFATSEMFAGCTSLSSVTFSGEINIGYASFSGCSSLTDVIFETTIGCEISGGAFKDCTSLSSITIPESSCLTPLRLGIAYDDNTNPIGAFQGCTSLESITFQSTYPPEFHNAASADDYQYMFKNTNNCPIYVPASSVNDYKTATGWSLFADRIQAITD